MPPSKRVRTAETTSLYINVRTGNSWLVDLLTLFTESTNEPGSIFANNAARFGDTGHQKTSFYQDDG